MSGAGNDFVVLDNMDSSLDPLLTEENIRNICRRRVSVGADGLISLEPDRELSFRMAYFNRDGGEAEMCGNGGRCTAVFAHLRGIVNGLEPFRFRSSAGVHRALVTGPADSRIWMTEPATHFQLREISVEAGTFHVSFLNTGVPHAVIFATEGDEDLFAAAAPLLRRHEVFGKSGANVDFAKVTGASSLKVRTWERGVEGETLACGTGAVAAAVCAWSQAGMELPVDVTTRSGNVLKVGRDPHGWWLEGEARVVYTGSMDNVNSDILTGNP